MPPQVPKAGPGHVTPHTSGEVQETKSQTIKNKTVESQKTPDDPNVAARAVQGSKSHATEQKGQQNVHAQVAQKNLQKQIPGAEKQQIDATGLKKGEKISAAVTSKSDGFHFNFDRPITKEQAAAIIFQDGKLPNNARLEGSGKEWTVKVPNDGEARENTIKHFNKREETINIPPRKPNDVYRPDPEITNTWTGGELKTTGPRQEKRLDLKNDMGFTIKNHYQLDPGQRQFGTLGYPGVGYEVNFDKPMTKAQVMDKLFDKEKIDKGGEVRLIPNSKEPATEWKVELIGADALSAFKTEPGHISSKVGSAFHDAGAYGKKSLPANTPPGIRAHLENQTIPANAEKLEKPSKDGKDVYVWEQDGYMMYVKTNNKGKDGYYEADPPTKMPDEKQGQKWMRDYVKKEGMPPQEAWQQFWKDTVDITRMGLARISGAYRPASSVKPRTPTGPSVPLGTTMRSAKGRPIPVTPAPGSQVRGGEPTPPAWGTQRTVLIQDVNGRSIKMTEAEYQSRIQKAFKWLEAERAHNPKWVEKGKTILHGPSPEETRRAATKFGLDLDWARIRTGLL